MKELYIIGVKETGYIDKRYNKPHTAIYSMFECPVCKKEYELKRTRGTRQKCCKDCRGELNKTHGKTNSKLYTVWQAMLQRCNNPNNKKYHIYGGKGVIVCDKWQTFEGFYEDNHSLYQDGLTIDRKDSNGNYCPENVRWISHSKNSSETTKRKPVIQYRISLVPIKSLIEVRQWESAKQAADELGLVAAHITATCQNKRKTHGGFAWQYQ